MKIKHLMLLIISIVALPTSAQIFNFSLRTNNQQLIDLALSGAFAKIDQSYELCDTVSNQHFGRDGKDYFSIIPFVGVETEKGFVFPKATLTPWVMDTDFSKYDGNYKPLVSKSKVCLLNIVNKEIGHEIESPIKGEKLSRNLCIVSDTTSQRKGLRVDTIPGIKNGWLIWISSNEDLANTDSVRFTSIKKEIEIPSNGESLRIDNPEISETVYGGIYLTPIQSSIGQLTFTLSGIMILDEDAWSLDFPFIKDPKDNPTLTPIKDIDNAKMPNTLKKKKK